MDMNGRRKLKNGALPRAALPYLRNAGWKPARAVPTALYEQGFASEGLPFPHKAEQFLREFGGLVIRYTTNTQQEDVLDFLAERAAQGMGGEGISQFEELTGVAPLCPIGHYLFGTCLILMDNRGRVFGGSDETVALLGSTGREAVGNILTGAESVVLSPKAT